MPNVLENCREKNTIKKYQCYYNKWTTWANQFTIQVYPAESKYVALFILNLIQNSISIDVIESCFYAIKVHHKALSKYDPCEAPLVANMFEAAKRMIKKSVKKKDIITVEHLQLMYNLCYNSTLVNLRALTICLLGFSGFMRFDEIVNISRSDIQFFDTYIKIFIVKSKTDIYREGAWIYIAKSDSELCAVKNLQNYFHQTNILPDSEMFIFRAISNGKVQTLRKGNKHISYTTARENFLKIMKQIDVDPKKFGLHSLRSGGASAAANNGIPDRLFKRHGRWKSEKAKDGYVEDSLESLLSVSQKLGI